MPSQSGNRGTLSGPKLPTSPFLIRLNQETNYRVFFQLIRDEACRRLEAEVASVFLLDMEGQELWFPLQENGQMLRLDARLGIAGNCIATGEVLNVQDVQSDSRFFSGIDLHTKRRTRTLLAVPLRMATGEILGVFEAVNKKGKAFSPRDEKIAQALVDEISIPLQKIQRMEQL